MLRDYTKVFKLTEWRSCWGAGWHLEVQSAPSCCSWPFSPQPGRRALWTARPCSCSRWWRRAAPDKPGRTSARKRRAGAASVPDAPAAARCQRRTQTLSFGWMSPQLHPRLQSSHISTMKLPESARRARTKRSFGSSMNGKLVDPPPQQWTHIIRSFQKYSVPLIFQVSLCHGSPGAQLPLVQTVNKSKRRCYEYIQTSPPTNTEIFCFKKLMVVLITLIDLHHFLDRLFGTVQITVNLLWFIQGLMRFTTERSLPETHCHTDDGKSILSNFSKLFRCP